VQYVVGVESVNSGEFSVQIQNSTGEEDLDNSESSGEEYDPQSVTVPVTLCLAIIVG
jgi:hypothetical protein